MRAVPKFAIAAVVLLTACADYEGFPESAEKLEIYRATAFVADFDLQKELRTATAACVTSEITGPASLSSLRGKGFVPYSDTGTKGYTKAESREGMARFEKLDVVRVSDQNSRLSCNVMVYRNKSYTAIGIISDEMQKLGYARVQSGRFIRYVGNGHRFMVDGMTSPYDAWAHIRISLIDPKSDRTCRDPALAPAFRQYCT